MTANPNGKRREASGGRQREWRRAIILIILAVIMVLAAVLAVLWTRWVQRPDLPGGDPAAESGEPGDGTDIDSVQPKVSGERKSEDFYTILVFGPDEVSGSTDVMMLVSYDVTNQQATVMSFPSSPARTMSGWMPARALRQPGQDRQGRSPPPVHTRAAASSPASVRLPEPAGPLRMYAWDRPRRAVSSSSCRFRGPLPARRVRFMGPYTRSNRSISTTKMVAPPTTTSTGMEG